MDTNLIYMPTFRVRQQETLVLKSFDFGNHMYPLLEIVKEHDRIRRADVQRSFEAIHNELINSIKAKHVFVDLPVYLKQSGSVKDEVVAFSFRVTNNVVRRCEYLNQLSRLSPKAIPVISSYLIKTGESDTIERQYSLLKNNFTSLAYRLFPLSFSVDFPIVRELIRPNDYLIIDLDQIPPYPSPPLKQIISTLKPFTGSCKILLRSAINTDIQNVNLDHDQIVIEADNNHIDIVHMGSFGVNATGDYVGIKKDDLTAGGTISPGFIYYDAIGNQYFGYKAAIKGSLSEFENRIVPDVLNSSATKGMLNHTPPFVSIDNPGYSTLLNIQSGSESGKSQAKFKKIAMEHYLHCIKIKIETNELYQTNVSKP
ncbi:Beta protein [anaerobic digester metagenome]